MAKGALSEIPLLGSIVAEVVGQIIPEQRTERLEAYVRLLGDRLRTIEQDDLDARFRDPENVDLFEEGAIQAARALSEERRVYIAALVGRGITGEENTRAEAKRLLSLLREIDDTQVIILASHLDKNCRDSDFMERHKAALEPVYATMNLDQATVDAEALKNAAEGQLVRLGLLGARFELPRNDRLPEFDQNTGLLKARGVSLTYLGRMLLRSIDLAQPDDY